VTQPPQYQQPYPGQPYQGGPYQQQPYQGRPQQQYQAPPSPYPPQPYPQQQGYQQPYQAPPQQGFQQQPYQAPQQQGYQQQPAYQPQAQTGGATCRVCGSAPAAQATFRGVVGAVFMHTIWTARGPFCRDCGLHTFRRQTTRTLTGGWCSVGALILTPIFLLMNIAARGKVADLPAPQPQGGHRAQVPLDPGPPVLQRPGAYVYPVLVFLFFALIVIGNLNR
jgi:hypothetical protein